jgi:hypothetical protein
VATAPSASAVRQAAQLDERRLRDALRQLAVGLAALHDKNKVHRDIKPSNIRVTNDGRTVLLDFGLVTSTAADEQGTDAQIAGTAQYMAPEQAASRPIGPAADWYAVGCVLYEALTGSTPFQGSPIEVLMDKQRFEPPPPRQLCPDVPRDLDTLCSDLLRTEPQARPRGSEVLKRLGAPASSSPAPATGTFSSFTQTPQFVGRAVELAALRTAFEDSRGTLPVTVVVSGESGVGKTALVGQFLEDMQHEGTRALVFSGRCYERESVPYKAFDQIIDAVSHYLSRLDRVMAALMLPEDFAVLARVFPVLRRIPLTERLPSTPEVRSPHELRTRAFLAARRLFGRLANEAPVVLFIDDFQWADADSLALLREVLSPPAAPPLLVLCTVRRDAQGQPALPPDALGADSAVRQVRLEGLSREEAQSLVEQLPGHSQTDVASLVEEARGHPLFLQELVRHLTSHAHVAGELRLEAILAARIAGLDASAQKLLELIATAHGPIMQKVVAQAAGLDPSAGGRTITQLRAGNFVRRTGSRDVDLVEPYHDRVRDAALARISPETQVQYHRALADALETTGVSGQDPRALVKHLEAAGEQRRAAEHAARAGHNAAEALAFDLAAELFNVAIRLGSAEDTERRHVLRISRAKALVDAGRGEQAAEEFMNAADGANAAVRLDCRRKAAEQLLISGHIDRGLDALQNVLAEIGVNLPLSPRRALFSVLWQRTKLKLRGLKSFARDESEISPHELTRLDVYKTISLGLGMVDTVRGADFHLRGLLLALKVGEQRRLGRFIAHEAIYRASEGRRTGKATEGLLSAMDRVVSDEPYFQGWAAAARGTANYLNGRFAVALTQVRDAQKLFREVPGTTWEMDSVRIFEMFCLRHMGRLAELSKCYQDYTRDAQRRGDRYLETTAIRLAMIHWLALDDPKSARRDLSRTTWEPPYHTYHLQHWYRVRAETEIGMYEGRLDDLGEWQDNLQALRRSLLTRIQTTRAESMWLGGRLSLHHADATRSTSDLALASVRQAARGLQNERVPYAAAWAGMLLAAVAYRTGDHDGCVGLLRSAADAAEAANMHLYAAVARWRLGCLLGAAAGAQIVEDAKLWMAGESVRNPDRLCAVIAPGFAPV